MKLWAMVPKTGMPYAKPARTLEVPWHPAMWLHRATFMPASTPCSLRNPNSITVLPWAAFMTLAAFVAIMVCRLMVLRRKVSTSCASIMGAVTRMRGSHGKAMVPSGAAQTSPVNLKSRR